MIISPLWTHPHEDYEEIIHGQIAQKNMKIKDEKTHINNEIR